MRRVFTKLLGTKVNSNDLTISAALEDQGGQIAEIHLTPNIAPALAHNLMGSAGYAEHLAEGGVPSNVDPDEKIVKPVVRSAAVFISGPASNGKYMLTVGCENGAEYNFSLTAEQLAALKKQP